MHMRRFGPLVREVPVIGAGTWNFPTRGAQVARAIEAIRAGIEVGLTHIDTAEMYGDGRSEEIIGEAIADIPRERLFIVSKVLPSNASYDGTLRACERSLRRLRTDYLDVYLLHWRGRIALQETMRALESLVDSASIRALGVSNFDVEDLDEARAALRTHPLVCNQVLYHLQERGIERRVLPYCRKHEIAIVGYSPLGSGDFPAHNSVRGRVLAQIAQRHGASPQQVALAFLVRLDGTFTIPKAAQPDHARENARAGSLNLSPEDIAAIDAAFPAPTRDGPLAVL
ncbi:MAG TPA: aldo/keto reductase [Candidatus Acidoferrales bacterium]|nr:aldo/keto reductase [Candidatus Acidoferrales bacterium]